MRTVAVSYADTNMVSVMVPPVSQSILLPPTSSPSLSPIALPAPQLVLLGSIAPSWRVVQPLLVTLERDEDGYYIVSDDEFAVYGDGYSIEEAVEDYKVSLIDYYQLLTARVDGDFLTQALLRRLERYLRPVAE